MEITYDPRYNIAFIKFRESVEEVEMLRLSDELNIDISADGKIYGLELLNANEQLTPEKGLKFLGPSPASGRARPVIYFIPVEARNATLADSSAVTPVRDRLGSLVSSAASATTPAPMKGSALPTRLNPFNQGLFA